MGFTRPLFTRWGVRAWLLALAVILLDQASKYWILEIVNLPARLTIPLTWPLSLTMVWNQGVSFGLLQASHDVMRWGLFVFSVAVAVMLSAWARRASRPFSAIGLGLVIGGAIGNAIDRARFGAVADFIDVQRLGFFPWIFNIADSAITIGVVFLLLDSLRKEPVAQPGVG